eukprot:CAMPEP_0198232452 /NCGR_PEP_ID=MMETSP1445-20131203/115740_1 /TAXON_ID=36898 /ORGANISM="Pyramimonas sp., Strain CCMP2087" /LENGTH=369 /DNA_ID=CAMNT_0043913129 /DNA_START=273 /DNA_END=1379 /DNA_ORIENTATION=+
MTHFVSLWLVILCGTNGVGVAGYCFRGDIPAEPFLITDFVEDAVKSCLSCGIRATRASTLLARNQLDMAMFFANSSLNCLCFLNDVHLTAEFWHTGGELATLFPRLRNPEDDNSLVHFPWTDRSVCLTSPSNLSLTSPPLLTFTQSTFEGQNLGFTLENANDEINVMVFDSLELDNVFYLGAPWQFIFAFPFGFLGMPAFGNADKHAASWKVAFVFHNSVAYGYCDSSPETVTFVRTLPDVFPGQFSLDRKTFLYFDGKLSAARKNVDCDPDKILDCFTRYSFLACCYVGETSTSTPDARQCVLDQDNAFRYDSLIEGTANFLRNSVCGAGNSSEENEHCPVPLDVCEATKCCLKTDPLTQRQTCVYRV